MFTKDITTRFGEIETPFYYYNLDVLRDTLQACQNAAQKYGYHVHYAMKANFNPKVLQTIQSYGFGADCVSGNEVKAAIEYGFNKDKVVFAGVGKSDKEINLALDAGIFCFNVESVQELLVINDLAGAKGQKANVAIRINPNVDAHTHHFITTGLEENKFGVNVWQLPDVADTLRNCKNLNLLGIHFHIGSQITDLETFKTLCTRVNELSEWFEQKGFNIKVLNVGGGFGVNYYSPDHDNIADFEAYFKVFSDFLNVKPNQEVHFELGRALVAQSASLIARVLYVKNGLKKNFLILDAGMTELIRPMLYQAYHQIENISRLSVAGSQLSDKAIIYDVVGPICESTDCFRKDVELPESFRGDLIAVRTAGAYGEVMASHYNLRDQVQSVYSE
ncbi:diaminopimelate decarboxylase [Mucilaginibacter polytrichastri]|uniref:Diaminopimelate decarboxylase n=1 Tax=Mucilaginibacter polytrichastri TaxID=1302689 RepID=A0A1Q5ZVQ3_9SPHI|nr:diaminopimelate decarboxylase [Mucilaginibacter polytrichastri]OKS85830.1 Diaminopimelate decarboxylase [Mucilaginibacter polytrichastri]SFS61210.1 diaminopimelate decarboxylase [Mucilaginibacter polytrichastri]